ncbi:MAG: hypothetical protein EXS14_02130 [Planctomycetes bacterium]|nr:hypothetical protein [Planctomycetota bacterium]
MNVSPESQRARPSETSRSTKKRIRPVQVLPTLVTLGNLIAGLIAMMKCLAAAATTDALVRTELQAQAGGLLFLAMVFDAVDGKVARMTGQTSRFGEQVDSICDVVSFGAAPALLFHQLMTSGETFIGARVAVVLASVYIAGAALRLARFNIETTSDEDSHRWFKGLPAPAAAAVVASLVILNADIDAAGDSWVRHGLPWAVGLCGLLMVSRLRYVHLTLWLFKRKSFTTMAVIVGLFALFAMYFEIMVPLTCVAFAASGPLLAVFTRRTPATTAQN